MYFSGRSEIFRPCTNLMEALIYPHPNESFLEPGLFNTFVSQLRSQESSCSQSSSLLSSCPNSPKMDSFHAHVFCCVFGGFMCFLWVLVFVVFLLFVFFFF